MKVAILFVGLFAYVMSSSIRTRRDAEDPMKAFKAWMTEEQQKKITDMKASGSDAEAMLKEVHGFFAALPADKQKTLVDELKGECRKYFDGVFDKADSDAIKELYQAGKKDEAKAKVTETIGKLADNIKPVAEKVQGVCMKIYEEAGHKHAKRHIAHRVRRDEVSVDDLADKYLQWMTPEQVTEIKGLKDNKKEAYTKVMEAFEKTEGDKRAQAVEQLKGACRAYIKHFVGEEKANELKKLKESGASNDEMKKKVEEFVGGLTDAATKERAQRVAAGCQKIFGVN